MLLSPINTAWGRKKQRRPHLKHLQIERTAVPAAPCRPCGVGPWSPRLSRQAGQGFLALRHGVCACDRWTEDCPCAHAVIMEIPAGRPAHCRLGRVRLDRGTMTLQCRGCNGWSGLG